MPLLAGWLSSLVVSLFGIFSAWLTARGALIAAVVAVSLALTVALFVAIQALVSGLISSVTYEPLLMAFTALWPSNAATCMAACFGSDLAVFLYRYKVDLVETLGG